MQGRGQRCGSWACPGPVQRERPVGRRRDGKLILALGESHGPVTAELSQLCCLHGASGERATRPELDTEFLNMS